MKKRIVSVLAMMLALVLVFTACTTAVAPSESESTPDDSSTEDSSTTDEPGSGEMEFKIGSPKHTGLYNPLYWTSSYDKAVVNLVYGQLTDITVDGKTIAHPLLVENMEISEDKLTYTFTIKQGVKFTNGEELKTSDILFTYKVLADPSSAARQTTLLPGLKNIKAYQAGETEEFEAVEVIDDYKIAFHFDEIARTNLECAGAGILSEVYYADINWDSVDDIMQEKMTEPVGFGPYILETFAADEFVTLVKNEEYFAKDETDYKVDRIVNKFVNTNLNIEEIIAGEIDFYPGEIDLGKVTQSTEEGLGLTQYKRSAFGFIGFNNQEGLMTNKSMRHAIAYCLDREAFRDSEFGKDLANVPNLQMSQASSIYEAVQGDIIQYKKDTAKAITELEAEGFKLEDGVMKDKDGNPVVLRFMATIENSVIDALIPVIEEDLKEIGIGLEANYIEFATMTEKLKEENVSDWDMFFMATSWATDEPDTWKTYTTPYIGGTNTTRFSNAEFDTLIDEGRKFLDLTAKEAQDHYAKAAIIINEELPLLPLYANIVSDIYNPRVKNYTGSTFVPWTTAIGQGMTIED